MIKQIIECAPLRDATRIDFKIKRNTPNKTTKKVACTPNNKKVDLSKNSKNFVDKKVDTKNPKD